jgi:hypothetical protein
MIEVVLVGLLLEYGDFDRQRIDMKKNRFEMLCPAQK